MSEHREAAPHHTPSHHAAAVMAGAVEERDAGAEALGELGALAQPEVERAVIGFRKRLINLRTMSWPLRLVTLLTFAALLGIGVALAAQGAQQPHTSLDVQGGKLTQVPTSVYYAGLVSLALFWAVTLTAALHGRWYIRFPVLALFSFFGLLDAGTGIPLGANVVQRFSGFLPTALSIQLGVIGGLWLRAIAISVINWRAGRSERNLNQERYIGVTLALTLVGLATHYAVAAVASDQANNTTVDLGRLPALVATEIDFVYLLFIPVIFIAGTDFAEVSEAIGGGIAHFARRRSPWLLAGLTALVALLTYGYMIALFYSVASEGATGLPQNAYTASRIALSGALVLAPATLIFALAGALLGWLALKLIEWVGATNRWPRVELPYWSYLGGAAAFGIVFALAVLLFVLGAPVGLVVVASVGGLALGLMALAHGRTRPGPLAGAGVFIALVTTLGVYASVLSFNRLPLLGALIAPATLLVIVWLVARRAVTHETAPLLAQLLILNIAIAAITAVYQVFASDNSRMSFGVLPAVAFISAFVWDLLTSGDSFTNRTSERFPRFVRVLLYLGYVLFAATAAIFFATETYADGSGQIEALKNLDGEFIAKIGLFALGVPMLLTNFLLRVSRWRGRHLPALAITPPSTPGRGTPPRPVAAYPYPYPAPAPGGYPAYPPYSPYPVAPPAYQPPHPQPHYPTAPYPPQWPQPAYPPQPQYPAPYPPYAPQGPYPPQPPHPGPGSPHPQYPGAHPQPPVAPPPPHPQPPHPQPPHPQPPHPQPPHPQPPQGPFPPA